MKASELNLIVEEFNTYYICGPSNMAVHFGCDCGCGGDTYTIEDWDELNILVNESYRNYKEFCEIYEIPWDYD